MNNFREKIGRYPLQKIRSEDEYLYKSAEYLYSHRAGFVWLAHVHDLKSGKHTLSVEIIVNGIRFRRWQERATTFTHHQLCHAARTFANEKSRT